MILGTCKIKNVKFKTIVTDAYIIVLSRMTKQDIQILILIIALMYNSFYTNKMFLSILTQA